MNSSFQTEINKEIQALNYTLDCVDSIDSIGHSIWKQQKTLSSNAQKPFSRINHILGHSKASVNLRKLTSYQASFDHKAMKLELRKNKRKLWKATQYKNNLIENRKT